MLRSKSKCETVVLFTTKEFCNETTSNYFGQSNSHAKDFEQKLFYFFCQQLDFRSTDDLFVSLCVFISFSISICDRFLRKNELLKCWFDLAMLRNLKKILFSSFQQKWVKQDPKDKKETSNSIDQIGFWNNLCFSTENVRLHNKRHPINDLTQNLWIVGANQ